MAKIHLFDTFRPEDNEIRVKEEKMIEKKISDVAKEIRENLEEFNSPDLLNADVKKYTKMTEKRIKKIEKLIVELHTLSFRHGLVVQEHLDWLESTKGIFSRD